MKFETSGKIREETKLPPEQQKLVDERGKKVKALFDAFEKGGGQPEVQEAKLRLKDLKESLEIHKKSLSQIVVEKI